MRTRQKSLVDFGVYPEDIKGYMSKSYTRAET